MSYSNALQFLTAKTPVIELVNQLGARVAVCPNWNGRIMTSSCNGLEGDSLGFINVRAINMGLNHQNQFGGENQLFCTSYPFWEEAFTVLELLGSFHLSLRRQIKHDSFDLYFSRKLTLLDSNLLSKFFSEEILDILSQPETSYTSYCSQNILQNRGEPFSWSTVFPFMQIKNAFNATPFSFILLPFRDGLEELTESPIDVQSFAPLPRRRLSLLKNTALFRADGVLDAHLSISQRRHFSYCGAVDCRAGILTILHFNEESSQNEMNDTGPAIQAHSHHNGLYDLPFYEICTSASRKLLETNESTTLYQTTTHITANLETLTFLTKSIFGVDFEEILNFISH